MVSSNFHRVFNSFEVTLIVNSFFDYVHFLVSNIDFHLDRRNYLKRNVQATIPSSKRPSHCSSATAAIFLVIRDADHIQIRKFLLQGERISDPFTSVVPKATELRSSKANAVLVSTLYKMEITTTPK